MEKFTHLTPSLSITEYKINITDLNYAELSEKLLPTKDVVAINSNFTHKTFPGYEHFITKPKTDRYNKNGSLDKRTRKKTHTTKRGGLHAGDRTVFNACIEFIVITDKSENTGLLRYFPKSGIIQSFNPITPIETLIHYLKESNMPEFDTIVLTGEPTPILKNYKFEIALNPNQYIDLSNLKTTLESGKYDDILPHPINCIKLGDSDKHRKIAIVLDNIGASLKPHKIRINIWPKSGKVNILGTKFESSATSIYNFLQHIFSESMDTLICPATPDN